MKTIKFKLHGETEIPQEWIDTVPGQGRADDDVRWLAQNYTVEVSASELTKYLTGLGFEAESLGDHKENIERLIWIASFDCQEQNTNYFYMSY